MTLMTLAAPNTVISTAYGRASPPSWRRNLACLLVAGLIHWLLLRLPSWAPAVQVVGAGHVLQVLLLAPTRVVARAVPPVAKPDKRFAPPNISPTPGTPPARAKPLAAQTTANVPIASPTTSQAEAESAPSHLDTQSLRAQLRDDMRRDALRKPQTLPGLAPASQEYETATRAKMAATIARPRREDCNTAYLDMQLLAIIPLAIDAATGTGCRWYNDNDRAALQHK